MKTKIIVMGSAPCLEDDLANLRKIAAVAEGDKLEDHFDLLAVGLDCADRYLGRIEHAVSYHPREFRELRERRKKAGGNLDYIEHSHCKPELGHRMWPFFAPSGSSAMLGCEVGIGLGYQKIIVAGVLLDGKIYKRFRKGWDVRYDTIKDKVRGLNGYPMELLGAPTPDWMKDII